MVTRTLLALTLSLATASCAGSDPKCPPQPAEATHAALPAAASPPSPAPPRRDAAEIKLEPYALVILRRGPAWTPEETPASNELQKQHLGHLGAMAKAGKMVVAGPFGDQKDETMRGLCLYRTSLDEARALAEQDPAVTAGRLRVEVLTWYTEKGALAFPMAEALAKGR
jgi:uncharacterized protein YciI